MFKTSKRKAAGLGIVAATLISGVAIGASTFADENEGGGGGGDAQPGHPVEATYSADAVTTGGTTFDPTLLTKFIPARGFIANQGDSVNADLVQYDGQGCLEPNSTSGGAFTDLFAPVELPDGSRIRRITFFGEDNAASNIEVQLVKVTVSTPILLGGSNSRSEEIVTSFTTAGETGVVVLSSDDNLEEITGSTTGGGIIVLGSSHRFYNVNVELQNVAGAGHVLCGVEVLYQAAASAADAGSVYHPINPVRAYDSRLAGYAPNNGTFAPNASKVISVKDAHDLNTGAVTTAGVVPDGATAVTYNLVAAGATGPNFLAITPGDAASFGASAINMGGPTLALANGGTVALAADGTVKVWLGGGPGSSDVIVDITGYYTGPVPYPNMAG